MKIKSIVILICSLGIFACNGESNTSLIIEDGASILTTESENDEPLAEVEEDLDSSIEDGEKSTEPEDAIRLPSRTLEETTLEEDSFVLDGPLREVAELNAEEDRPTLDMTDQRITQEGQLAPVKLDPRGSVRRIIVPNQVNVINGNAFCEDHPEIPGC